MQSVPSQKHHTKPHRSHRSNNCSTSGLFKSKRASINKSNAMATCRPMGLFLPEKRSKKTCPFFQVALCSCSWSLACSHWVALSPPMADFPPLASAIAFGQLGWAPGPKIPMTGPVWSDLRPLLGLPLSLAVCPCWKPTAVAASRGVPKCGLGRAGFQSCALALARGQHPRANPATSLLLANLANMLLPELRIIWAPMADNPGLLGGNFLFRGLVKDALCMVGCRAGAWV